MWLITVTVMPQIILWKYATCFVFFEWLLIFYTRFTVQITPIMLRKCVDNQMFCVSHILNNLFSWYRSFNDKP